MKKFFKPKEAGTITPLPPASPGAHSSSFSTPRPFDEYQARMASHARESNRPLSLQVPPSASRSAPDSPERSSYARTYSPTSQQRRAQQLGASPRKNRSPNHLHAIQAADTAYDSYSDPISAHSQSFRPSFERQDTSDYDLRSSPTPRRTNSKRDSQQQRQQQQPPHTAAFSPPRSLRPAQPAAHQHHRRDNSWSTGIASGAASHQSHGQGRNGERHSLQVALGSLVSPQFAGPARRQRSDDNYDSHDDTFHHDLDERTPTASDAPRSAAYPVYSGADGDDDAGEVLISQGRYEETTLRDPNPKDKSKAKKLFGFATGSGKDKKEKQDRDIAVTAPSPIPRHSRDRDDLRLVSPPVNSQPLSPQERSKEGGWMDRWNKRAHQQQAAKLHDKEAEEAVASHIGWLSANANEEQDWMQILPLIDIISHSDAASKEAARALRKEFKYGAVDTQRRAVRIWALLTLNSSDRFRLQVASKRFLDAIEDSIASSKTPLSVKETMLRVLGVLAFEFRDDAELVSVTKCWNKVKPNDRKKDGEPLEDDLFEFRLPQPTGLMQQPQQPGFRRASQRRSQPPRRGADYHEPDFGASPPQQRPFTADSADQQRHLHSAAFAPPPLPPGISASIQLQAAPPEQQPGWPRPNAPPSSLQPQTRTSAAVVSPPMMVDQHDSRGATDVVSTLEAAAASMDSRSASMHSNHSSASQRDDVLTFDEDVRRLHEECQIARSNAAVLVDTLLHEGLHSGTLELVEEFHSKVVRSQDLIASQIPWASAQADRSRAAVPVGGERETREEALLADLLEAHGRSGEAIHMVEDARRRIEEEEAERQATERSKVEVRLDRSALAQDSLTGELYDVGGRGRAGLLGVQASGSRSPSPNAGGFTSTQKAASSASSGVNPVFASANGNGAPVLPPRISRPLPVPRSDQSSDSNTSTTSFAHPHHTTAHSLTASIHSTTSSITSSTHSRDTPLNAAGGRSPLPVTPPSLNIDTKKKGWEEEEGDELQTPVVPSEKALGKRRAVSVRYPTPPQGQKAPPFPPQPGMGDAVGAMGGLRLG